MAKNTFADLDVTPANNGDLLNQNASGNADANTIDTLFQNFAAMTARFYGDIGGLGTVGGSANAVTLTSLSTYQGLEDGLIVAVKASAANTGAATLNLDGIGAKAIRKPGDLVLSAGEMAANGRYLFMYDAAYNAAAGAWVLMNPTPKLVTGIQLSAEATSYPIFGGGRLTYASTTSVKLTPWNGNLVTFPSGVQGIIPSAGITSTITSTTLCYINGVVGAALSATTLYYAYLWNQGSVGTPNWVIDWSTTGHATDTATGIEIKSGDATRVLVGMIRTNAGPVIADSATSRLVASWFNRRPRLLSNKFSSDRSTASTSFTEINTEIRSAFVCWDGSVAIAYAGNAYASSGTVNCFGGPTIDGATSGFPATKNAVGTAGQSASSAGSMDAAEGYHYLTYVGAVASGTGNWDAASEMGRLTATLFI